MSTLFQSFFIGGFECSTQKRADGRRLDLLAATQHDRYARQDFARLLQQNISTIRSGVRWHLIETAPYRYDFSSLLPYLKAARDYDIQVIWDLCHYGYPDDLDIFSTEFERRFRHFVEAVVRVIDSESEQTPYFCPVNEISFWSWAGGDSIHMNPFAAGRSFELKKQLARATIGAIDVIWEKRPLARIALVDPVVHIVHDPSHPDERWTAEGYRLAQFQAWDMIGGRMCPELGGKPEYLDILGLNFYANNEWVYEGPILTFGHPEYRLFRHIAREVYTYYQRPMFIAETGIEGDMRPGWLRYMVDETIALIEEGIPMEGLCLYPILCYPGWIDDRHCPAGLWDYASEHGERAIYQPLAEALSYHQARIARVLEVPRAIA